MIAVKLATSAWDSFIYFVYKYLLSNTSVYLATGVTLKYKTLQLKTKILISKKKFLLTNFDQTNIC